MQDKIAQMICMDLDALASKVVNLLPESKERVLASGLLVAAAHILGSRSPTAQPAQPIPDFNQANQDVAGIAAAIAQRMGVDPSQLQPPARSLSKEWSGPLPHLNNSTKTKAKAKPQAIPHVPATAKCPGCGDPVGDHPRDKNFDIDINQRAVLILCDQTRVRCVPTDI